MDDEYSLSIDDLTDMGFRGRYDQLACGSLKFSPHERHRKRWTVDYCGQRYYLLYEPQTLADVRRLMREVPDSVGSIEEDFDIPW